MFCQIILYGVYVCIYMIYHKINDFLEIILFFGLHIKKNIACNKLTLPINVVYVDIKILMKVPT